MLNKSETPSAPLTQHWTELRPCWASCPSAGQDPWGLPALCRRNRQAPCRAEQCKVSLVCSTCMGAGQEPAQSLPGAAAASALGQSFQPKQQLPGPLAAAPACFNLTMNLGFFCGFLF